MRSSINLILIMMLAGSLAAAQSPPTTKLPDSPGSGMAGNLPTEATVDSFLQQTFGYDSKLSWKISSIKPAPVPGLAQIEVILASPQGQQLSRFFVTPDGEHAVVGDMIPFGASRALPAHRADRKTLRLRLSSSEICSARRARRRSLRSRP